MTTGIDTPGLPQLAHREGLRESVFARGVDLGLIGILGIAPLFMGGRHPVGETVYISLVFLTAACAIAARAFGPLTAWRKSGIEWIALLGLAVLGLQLVPLSIETLSKLSPATAQFLPSWFPSSGNSPWGSWTTLSLMPSATWAALSIYVAHVLLFLVVIQRLNTLEDIERLLRWMAVAVVAMALLGIVQLVAGNGKFLWVYEHPFRTTHRAAKGVFANENHFGHYLALGLGPLLWWLARASSAWSADRASRSERAPSRHSRSGSTRATSSTGDRSSGIDRTRFVLSIGIAIVLFAGLLTFSRGGVIALFVTTIVCVGIFAWRQVLERKTIAVLAGVGLLVGAALVIFGEETLAAQLQTLGAGSLEDLDSNAARRKLWEADLIAVRHFPYLGTGGGTHREVYPTFFSHYSPVEFSHAESGYIQITQEYGLVGAILLLVIIGTAGRWCFRAMMQSTSRRTAACVGAVIASLAANMTQSIWDFVWFIPTCMTFTILLGGCACRLSQLAIQGASASHNRRGEQVQPPIGATRSPLFAGFGRLVACGALAGVCGLGYCLLPASLGAAQGATHWEQYLVAGELIKKDPDSARELENNDIRLHHLQETVRLDPGHARAHLTISAIYLQRFDIVQAASDNPMPIDQIREVVTISQFESPEKRDAWLAAAVGDNIENLRLARQHALEALRQCPLQGEAYVYLTEMDFMSDLSVTNTALVTQGLKVRPYRGAVLLTAGLLASQQGDAKLALDYWRTAFHQDPETQSRLISLLTPRVPAKFLWMEFRPDATAAQRIYKAYQSLGRKDQALAMSLPYAQLMERDAAMKSGVHAARAWMEIYRVYQTRKDDVNSLAAVQQAIHADPQNLQNRQVCGMELLRQEQFAQAAEQFQWCLYRRPHDQNLDALLTRAKRLALRKGPSSPDPATQASTPVASRPIETQRN